MSVSCRHLSTWPTVLHQSIRHDLYLLARSFLVPPTRFFCQSREKPVPLRLLLAALRQACEEGGQRWYASTTLELQLASLEFCRACRNVPTLHVRVEDDAPRSLGSPPDEMNTRSSEKGRISSRVPVVRVVRLTWSLPLEVLVKECSHRALSGHGRLLCTCGDSRAHLGRDW